MLTYIVTGLIGGGVYAISALGLVLTYRSSRIFNFGHGAIAYLIARLFWELTAARTSGGNEWALWPAAAFCVLLVAPLLGFLLWAGLFRRLSGAPATVKVVTTVGLYVAIPPVAQYFMGEQVDPAPVGLGGERPGIYEILGVNFNTNQLFAVAAAGTVAVLLTVLIRYTSLGLSIRAVVDSEVMSELVGTNSQLVSASAWMIGSTLAGLSGVLLVPLLGLDPNAYSFLLVTSLAAVVIARLDSLPLAFLGGLLLGVTIDLAKRYLPSDEFFSRGVPQSVPFIVIGVALLVYQLTGRDQRDAEARSMRPRAVDNLVTARPTGLRRHLPLCIGIALALATPWVVDSVWGGFYMGAVADGVGLSIILLSYVVVAGEGGMISLSQVSFAGIGAVTTAQLATEHGWPLLPAVLVGGLLAMPFGAVLALLALRVGNLFLALATLAFALLMDNVVFPREQFSNFNNGLPIAAPEFLGIDFAESKTRMYFLLLAVFAICAIGVANLQRTTTGLALAAVRSSEPASATLGISLVRARLTAFAMSAFIAGIGGGVLATTRGRAIPSSYAALFGLILLTVAVTWGIRSKLGALMAGVSLAVFPVIISNALSTESAKLVPALFGIAAIQLAKEPRGIVVMIVEQFRRLRHRLRRRPPVGVATAPAT
ncbi:MAG: ABC transporter permease subunit [Acidimicrobiales bacterium]